jgi:hypothetical protein
MRIGVRHYRVFSKKIFMEKSEFEDLSLNEKARHVWLNGEYLETVHYEQYLVNIYHFSKADNYGFAEVFYNPTADEIEKISLVEKLDLNKFLTRIDISDINKQLGQ